MSENKVAKMRWVGNMMFHSKTLSGHDLLIDSSPDVGGYDAAPRPKELILYSLMGCTGMDVVYILKKMRILDKIEDFYMESEYEMGKNHPKFYEKIRLKYFFKIKNDSIKSNIEKAVKLSQEKYCGVSYALKKIVDFSYEVIYI